MYALKPLSWGPAGFTTQIDGCANPFRGLDGRGIYLHRLCLNLIAARRMSP